MKPAESAAGRSWRLLAEHNRTIAAFMARRDGKATLLRTAAEYEVKADLEDQRAAARQAHRSAAAAVRPADL